MSLVLTIPPEIMGIPAVPGHRPRSVLTTVSECQVSPLHPKVSYPTLAYLILLYGTHLVLTKCVLVPEAIILKIISNATK